MYSDDDKLIKLKKEDSIKNCKSCGREYKSSESSEGLCPKHYSQLKKYGKVLDDNPRNAFDKNDIVITEGNAEIILYDKSGCEVCRSILDIDDVDKIKDIKWYYKNKYVLSNKVGRLHRYIMNCNDKNLVVDHINRNTLDNRKKNLRICTYQANSINRSIQKNNSTGITGVCYSNEKYYAHIQIDNKKINLGSYDDIESAKKIRLEAEKKYFKEYNPIN